MPQKEEFHHDIYLTSHPLLLRYCEETKESKTSKWELLIPRGELSSQDMVSPTGIGARRKQQSQINIWTSIVFESWRIIDPVNFCFLLAFYYTIFLYKHIVIIREKGSTLYCAIDDV